MNPVTKMGTLPAGVEVLRALSGAGIKTRDNPTNLIDYVPISGDAGGFFDRGRVRGKKGGKKGSGLLEKKASGWSRFFKR